MQFVFVGTLVIRLVLLYSTPAAQKPHGSSHPLLVFVLKAGLKGFEKPPSIRENYISIDCLNFSYQSIKSLDA